MATYTPYGRLVGTWKFYVATASTAIPNLDASPSASWTQLGNTDGDQSLSWSGGLTTMRDNHSIGRIKHIRPESDFMVTASISNLSLEDLARVLGMSTADVATGTSGALAYKKLGLIADFNPQRYALLARGGVLETSNVMSTYGAWPAQLWIPRGVFDAEPTMTFSRTGTGPVLQFNFIAEIDSTQSAGEQYGYLMMQSS